MGKLVFGMMQSLDGCVAGVAGGPGSDGYVAGLASGLELPPPGVSLSRHFNDHVRSLAGSLCGRRMYEVMRYWDEDQPDWDVGDHDFAALWRGRTGKGVLPSPHSGWGHPPLPSGAGPTLVRRVSAGGGRGNDPPPAAPPRGRTPPR